jgi:glycosyltransferase involved in cell wall biosynthesis
VREPLAFTVVVPTRNRPQSLGRCLTAVERQDAPGPFEIVVVDDGSADDRAVASVVASHARARYVQQEPSGSVSARNRGVREARAPVVLLLDDDCEPRPDWARLLLEQIDDATRAAWTVHQRRPVTTWRGHGHPDYLTMQSAGK